MRLLVSRTIRIMSLHSLHFLLLPKPLMEIHLVDLVETLLVQFSRLPHLLEHFVELLGIVVGHKLLDVVQLLVRLDSSKDVKKEELCRIKHSRLRMKGSVGCIHKKKMSVFECKYRYKYSLAQINGGKSLSKYFVYNI